MAITLKVPSRALVLLAVVVIALLLLATAVSAIGADETPGAVTVEYTVKSGDSLWAVAAAAVPDADTRETVHAIRRLNDLSGSTIHPGQVLRVPGD